MKAVIVVALRAAGVTTIALPILWLVFGGAPNFAARSVLAVGIAAVVVIGAVGLHRVRTGDGLKAVILVALRAAGVTAIVLPIVWLVFGGAAIWPTDVPPLGLENVGWRPSNPGPAYYIAFGGWLLLALVFVLVFLVSLARRRQGGAPARSWSRPLDAILVVIGGGVLAAAVIGAITVISAPVEYRLVDPNCTPGMYIQRLCDDSYYPDPPSSFEPPSPLTPRPP